MQQKQKNIHTQHNNKNKKTYVFLCLANLGSDAVVRPSAVLGTSPDEDHVLCLRPVREPFRQEAKLFWKQGLRENLLPSPRTQTVGMKRVREKKAQQKQTRHVKNKNEEKVHKSAEKNTGKCGSKSVCEKEREKKKKGWESEQYTNSTRGAYVWYACKNKKENTQRKQTRAKIE